MRDVPDASLEVEELFARAVSNGRGFWGDENLCATASFIESKVVRVRRLMAANGYEQQRRLTPFNRFAFTQRHCGKTDESICASWASCGKSPVFQPASVSISGCPVMETGRLSMLRRRPGRLFRRLIMVVNAAFR